MNVFAVVDELPNVLIGDIGVKLLLIFFDEFVNEESTVRSSHHQTNNSPCKVLHLAVVNQRQHELATRLVHLNTPFLTHMLEILPTGEGSYSGNIGD